jgi:predicted DNA-binding transcriptional regulator YafY
VYTAPRTAPADADVDAQLAVLRDGPSGSDTAAPGARNSAGTPGAEAATQLGLETLQKAIRLKQPVVMNVVDGLGNATRETVVPVAVNGGRVRVFDPAKETERVLSIHRIIDVEATEELLQ